MRSHPQAFRIRTSAFAPLRGRQRADSHSAVIRSIPHSQEPTHYGERSPALGAGVACPFVLWAAALPDRSKTGPRPVRNRERGIQHASVRPASWTCPGGLRGRIPRGITTSSLPPPATVAHGLAIRAPRGRICTHVNDMVLASLRQVSTPCPRVPGIVAESPRASGQWIPGDPPDPCLDPPLQNFHSHDAQVGA
jgi:hypothetical protein